MKVRALCFTPAGAEIITRLQEALPQAEILGRIKAQDTQAAKIEALEGTTASFLQAAFNEGTPLLIVGAMGIAVRLIAPFIHSKLQDIPVLAMDETGAFVIPILSGHAGGANRLAELLAEATGAVPVITTATDRNGCFAADVFARENRLTIQNKDAIKAVSAKALRHEPIVIAVEDLSAAPQADVIIARKQVAEGALWLSPKMYVLGIGCRKGKSLQEIEQAVEAALQQLGIGYQDVYAFGSVDRKAKEEGLLAFSAKHRIPFVTFTSDMLMRLDGDFTASAFVQATVGTDNVCERAALLLTKGQGKLVLKKQAADGVTVAAALRDGV